VSKIRATDTYYGKQMNSGEQKLENKHGGKIHKTVDKTDVKF
jgi:hypothetical protein